MQTQAMEFRAFEDEVLGIIPGPNTEETRSSEKN
jgi:hypothetical protein